jgi:chromosome segregation ATPase
MAEENIKKTDISLEDSEELLDLLERVNEGIIDGRYLVDKMESFIANKEIPNKEQHLQVVRFLRIDRNPSNLFFYFLLLYQADILKSIALQNNRFAKSGNFFIKLLDKKFEDQIDGFNNNTKAVSEVVSTLDNKINRLSEVTTDNINNIEEKVNESIDKIDQAINKHSDFIEGLSISIEAFKEELSSDGLQRKLDDLKFGNSMTSIGKLTEELNNLGNTLTNINSLESNIQSILQKNEELEKDNIELKSQNKDIKEKVTKMETSIKSVETMLKELTNKNKTTNTTSKNNLPQKVNRNFLERLKYLFSGD